MMNKKMNIAEKISANPAMAFFAMTVAIGLVLSGAIYLFKLDIYGSAFGILVYLIYMLCPAIVAIVLLVVFEGKEEVMDLLGSLFRWRIGLQWYILAVLLPIAVEALTFGIYLWMNGQLPLGYNFSPLSWNIALDILIATIGLSLGLGFMLPLLLKTYTPAVSTTIVALFLVLYRAVALASDPNVIAMCIGLVALALVLVWMYNNARNSLLIVALFLFLNTLLFNQFSSRLYIYSGSGLPVYVNKVLLIAGILLFYVTFRFFSLDEP